MTKLTRRTLRALFLDQRDRLFRYLYRLTGDAGEAEDLLQDTFLTVWRKRDQFEGRGSPEGYLRKTAYRLFLNRRQVRARRPGSEAMEVDELVPEGPLETAELERREALEFLTARVREALETLPDGAREAFLLFRYEGFTCREIAEATGVNLKTVETRVRRATELLAERLRPYRDHLPAG